MIVLYHAPGSRSCRVRWLLEELGVDYRLAPLSFHDGSLRQPEYLALNPLGKVPTLEDEGVVLFESGAIVEYLLERYGEGRLAPEPGTPDRARFLQWVHWSEATLLPPLGELVQHAFLRPEEERIAAVVPDAARRFQRALLALDAALAGREYLVGDTFSAADVMMGYVVKLAQLVGQLPPEAEHARAYLDRLATRAAFQKAFAG